MSGGENWKKKKTKRKRKKVFEWKVVKRVHQVDFLLPAFSSLACFCFSPLLDGGEVFDVDSMISVLSSARLELILARRLFSISGLLARFVSLPPSITSFSTLL